MKVEDIQIGKKIEIEVDIVSDNKPSFISQFEMIDGNESIYISAPIKEGHVIPIQPGTNLNIYFIQKFDLYRIKVTVEDQITRETFPLLKIAPISSIERIQRRQFFRYECLLPIEYRTIHQIDSEGSIEDEFHRSSLVDISGGGLCLLVDRKIEYGSIIECRLTLDGTLPMAFTSKVVRSTECEHSKKYKYELGIWFKKIQNVDRETVIRYIFIEQRKLRKKGLI